MKYFIIPGIGGSKIYCCCGSRRVKLYPKKLYKVLSDIDAHFFDKKCKVETKPLKRIFQLSVYDTLCRKLGKENCILYSYDWRKSPLEVAKELVDVIPRGSTIIGHSNGGFIVRILFEYLNVPRSHYGNIFICSTPFFGSTNPFMYNHEENVYRRLKCPSLKGNYKSIMLNDTDMEMIFLHFTSTLLYYLPTHRLNDKSLCHITDPVDLEIVKSVHFILSRMRVDGYFFYYNIHHRTSVCLEMKNDEIFNKSQLIPVAEKVVNKNENYVIKYKVNTDTLVVPTNHFPPNTTIIYDTVPLSHAFTMNSQFLVNIIKSSPATSHLL